MKNNDDFEVYGYICNSDSISMKKKVYATPEEFVNDYYNSLENLENDLNAFRIVDLIKTVSYRGQIISKTFQTIEETVNYYRTC